MSDQIINHYANDYNESIRLTRDNAHMTEYLTTIRYFDKLFATQSHILDACAGAGIYSFYLAEQGHIVTAGDLVPHHIDQIKAHPNASKLADTAVCNVLDLSQFADNSFDVVLCMGALYHLWAPEERQKAVQECTRVCKPGGLVLLAYINKIAAVLENINDDVSNVDSLISVLECPDECMFVCLSPQEVEALAMSCGLKKRHNLTTDGIIYAVAAKLNAATDEDFQKYMQYHYSICEDPAIIGAGIHGLWIGQKPTAAKSPQ